jgi:hypothetical protein
LITERAPVEVERARDRCTLITGATNAQQNAPLKRDLIDRWLQFDNVRAPIDATFLDANMGVPARNRYACGFVGVLFVGAENGSTRQPAVRHRRADERYHHRHSCPNRTAKHAPTPLTESQRLGARGGGFAPNSWQRRDRVG